MPQQTSKRILVTSAGWQGALACTQCLGRLGHEIYILSHKETIPINHSRFVTDYFVTPKESDEEAYLMVILDLLKKYAFDVVIPISDIATVFFAKYKEELSEFARIPIGSYETIQLVNDKTKTYRFAINNNITIPTTYFPASMSELTNIIQQITFPCIVKYAFGSASQSVFQIKTTEELIEFFKNIPKNTTWPMIQELINSDFFGLTANCCNGEIIDYLGFRTELEHTHGGTPPFAYSFVDEKLLHTARQLIEKLNYTGPIDLDYLQNTEGAYTLLEINPRFSGTLNLAIKLGIQLPQTFVDLAYNEHKVKEIQYPTDILHRSIFDHEILWTYKNKKYIQFMLNFFKIKTKTNIYLDDLPLLAAQLKQAYWSIQYRKKHQNEKN